MRTCETCGAGIPDHETLCRSCNKRASGYTDSQTIVQNSRTEASANLNTDHATVPISTEPKAYHTVPIHVVEKEDEEERRRRIAMLDPEFYSPGEEQSSNGAIPLPPVAALTTRENIPQVS